MIFNTLESLGFGYCPAKTNMQGSHIVPELLGHAHAETPVQRGDQAETLIDPHHKVPSHHP